MEMKHLNQLYNPKFVNNLFAHELLPHLQDIGFSDLDVLLEDHPNHLCLYLLGDEDHQNIHRHLLQFFSHAFEQDLSRVCPGPYGSSKGESLEQRLYLDDYARELRNRRS